MVFLEADGVDAGVRASPLRRRADRFDGIAARGVDRLAAATARQLQAIGEDIDGDHAARALEQRASLSHQPYGAAAEYRDGIGALGLAPARRGPARRDDVRKEQGFVVRKLV